MDLDKVQDFVKKNHAGQTRKQGTPYYEHPCRVAEILKEFGYGEAYIAVALCHDLLEDTLASYEEIKDLSSQEVADAVVCLTKEKGYKMEEYIRRIRACELAWKVKIADRIHNLAEAKYGGEEFVEKYKKETRDWYLELAKGTNLEAKLKEVLAELEKF